VASVAGVERDHSLRVSLLRIDIGSEEEEVVMATKGGVKLSLGVGSVRRIFCVQRHSEVVS